VGSYQTDSPVPKMPAQAGIHLLPSPEALEDTARDGPLPAQGPAEERGNPNSPTKSASPAHAGVSRR